jgi:uncharacterized membrane protein YqgA involved in biofilm formation
MLGTIVNAAAVLVCAFAGAFLVGRRIPGRFEGILKTSVGLALICMGVKGAIESRRAPLFIMSVAAGGLLGELIDIEGAMGRLGSGIEKKLNRRKTAGGRTGGEQAAGEQTGGFAHGFVSASILFCAGSMSIVGAIQGGLTGNHEILFAKSLMDGAFALIFGAAMGIGVALSALVILIYQGGIALAAMAFRDFLPADMIREVSAVGSLLLCAIGFNFLGLKNIRAANLIPAMFIPCIYLALEWVLGR